MEKVKYGFISEDIDRICKMALDVYKLEKEGYGPFIYLLSRIDPTDPIMKFFPIEKLALFTKKCSVVDENNLEYVRTFFYKLSNTLSKTYGKDNIPSFGEEFDRCWIMNPCHDDPLEYIQNREKRREIIKQLKEKEQVQTFPRK